MLTSAREGDSFHAYLVWDEATREAALFDAGWDIAVVRQFVADHQLSLKHLFLTQSPLEERIGAVTALRNSVPGLRLHTNSASAPPEHRNRPNECVSLGSLRITHRNLGSLASADVIYLVGNWPDDAPHAAFIGDALPSGGAADASVSAEEMARRVRETVLTLPDDTLLCPRHGLVSTVAGEKERISRAGGSPDPPPGQASRPVQ
ncbi:MAG: hydroxyacylglutathione hydrolase [Verrucomicrobiota bacterium]|jgi:hypothetical protein